MPSSDSITAIILAAGGSRRLGFPKALFEVGPQTALERIVDLCRSEEMQVCVVLGSDAERIQKTVDLSKVSVVVNPAPERGQTSSLRIALQHLPPHEAICLFPVDHAFVQAATLHQLIHCFRNRTEDYQVVVPSYNQRRGHPVFVSPIVARELAELRDDDPAHLVIRRETRRILHVVCSDPAVVRDVDTTDDLDWHQGR